MAVTYATSLTQEINRKQACINVICNIPRKIPCQRNVLLKHTRLVYILAACMSVLQISSKKYNKTDE